MNMKIVTLTLLFTCVDLCLIQNPYAQFVVTFRCTDGGNTANALRGRNPVR